MVLAATPPYHKQCHKNMSGISRKKGGEGGRYEKGGYERNQEEDEEQEGEGRKGEGEMKQGGKEKWEKKKGRKKKWALPGRDQTHAETWGGGGGG